LRITPKAQVTIPVKIREQLDLLPGCEVDLEVVDNALKVRRARARQKRPSAGRTAAGQGQRAHEHGRDPGPHAGTPVIGVE